MGIIYSNAAFLLEAKQRGVSFDRTLTLGRQTLFLTPSEVVRLASVSGRAIDVSQVPYLGAADGLFRMMLEAKHVESVDYSDFEGAAIVHDMNAPIDPRHHEQFDVVIDGGSLEHIFNFPVAIANCMQMVRTGGSLFVFSQANNHMGHGFYQFSPELFFRIFQPGNGYEMRSVVLVEHPFPGAELSGKRTCWAVEDPARVRERIGLVSRSPVGIMVHAVRVEAKPVFASPPIQSDYAAIYNDATGSHSTVAGVGAAPRKSAKRRLLERLPVSVQNFYYGLKQLKRYSFGNARFYRRWNPF